MSYIQIGLLVGDCRCHPLLDERDGEAQSPDPKLPACDGSGGGGVRDKHCHAAILWHPDFGTQAGCSNKNDVPGDWHKFFGRSDERCGKYLDADGACSLRNVCSVRKGVTYLPGSCVFCC